MHGNFWCMKHPARPCVLSDIAKSISIVSATTLTVESALSSDALKGCEVVLLSKIGFEPWGELENSQAFSLTASNADRPTEASNMAVHGELADGDKRVG